MSSLDTDDTLRLLAPRRRRAVLRVLLERPGRAVDVSDLAGQVRERCPPDRLPGTRADIQVQLQHTDLPKLDGAGLLTYDRANGHVTYQGDDDVEALLETLATLFE